MLQISFYGPEGKFQIHGDGNLRSMTLILYLNDVPDGGETRFSRRTKQEDEYAKIIRTKVLEARAKNRVAQKGGEFMAKQVKKRRNRRATITRMLGHERLQGEQIQTAIADMDLPPDKRLDVKPKEGMAVIFFPPDPRSRHEGRPVESHKWFAQQWIRIDPIPDGTDPSCTGVGKR